MPQLFDATRASCLAISLVIISSADCGRILRCGQRHQIGDGTRRIGSLAANAFSDLVERSPEVLILLFKGCVQLAKIRPLHIPVIAVGLHIQTKRLSQHCVQSLDVDLEYGGHDVCSRNE